LARRRVLQRAHQQRQRIRDISRTRHFRSQAAQQESSSWKMKLRARNRAMAVIRGNIKITSNSLKVERRIVF